MDSYWVRLWYNAHYTPQHNPAERAIKTMKTALRAYVQDQHRDWDIYLPQVGCALRTHIHESTKYSPYFTNFGQEMACSGDMVVLDDKLQDLDIPQDRYKLLCKIREEINSNISKAYQQYSKQYNLRSRKVVFRPGDYVLKRNFTLSSASKGYTSGLGPVFVKCKIKEQLGSNCYRLANLEGKDIGVFHVKDLKVFYQ